MKSTARGELDSAWEKKTGASGAQGKLSSVEVYSTNVNCPWSYGF